jgi:putative DNA primase/helicase
MAIMSNENAESLDAISRVYRDMSQNTIPPESALPPDFRSKLEDPGISNNGHLPDSPEPDAPPDLSGDNSADNHRLPGDLTDTGNADRLVRLFRDRLRWVGEWGWLFYDGKRWAHDRADLVLRFAKQTARNIYREAAEASDDNRTKNLASWAGKSLNKSRLDAMVDLARPELPARPEDFDTDPMVLNVRNGLLDLRTGELLPHSREQMVTKLAGAAYDPAAKCPTFEGFLERVLVEHETIDFVWRAVGYSLTGEVSEQALFFLYGNGANGKTTFCRAILNVLGDYGKQAAPQFLMIGDRHPTEIADLRGARFVCTIEIEEGRFMAEVLTKQLTGGDILKARFMRQDFFQFEPTHKIFLASNHKPVIRGTDHAIWRRIRLVPFEVTIPEAEQDPGLGDKLRAELPGILTWAVRGCLEWQRTGLAIPQKVRQATDAYREEMDILATFLEECCIVNSLASVTAGVLYSAYKLWAEQNSEHPITHRAFSARLQERGFSASTRDGAGRAVIFGIGLLAKDGENA